MELCRSVLEKEEFLAWQHLQLLGAARPFYTHEKCSRCFRLQNRAALPVYRGVKLQGKFREGKSKQHMGGQPRHLYHQVTRRPHQQEFCSDSGGEYITGYTQDMCVPHFSPGTPHSFPSAVISALHSSILPCNSVQPFPTGPGTRHFLLET